MFGAPRTLEGVEANVATLTPPVDLDRDHVRGPVEAAVTLVEYGDYQCPYCGDAYPVVNELLARFGDRLRVVFRHMPLEDIHPRARAAALAAEAAAAQGRFWDMHDRLFQHQRELGDAQLRGHAEAIGLDLDRFDRDLADPELARRVEDDEASGARSGVPSTPRFFVNNVIHLGSPSLTELEEAIELELG
jgi:Na+:H+ antiporter, NhaA family